MADLAAAIREAESVLAGHPVSVENPKNPRVAAEDALRTALTALRWAEREIAREHGACLVVMQERGTAVDAKTKAEAALAEAQAEPCGDCLGYESQIVALEAALAEAKHDLTATRNSLVRARAANRVLTKSRDRAEAAAAEERCARADAAADAYLNAMEREQEAKDAAIGRAVAAEARCAELERLLDPAVVEAARYMAQNAAKHPNACCLKCSAAIAAAESRAARYEAALRKARRLIDCGMEGAALGVIESALVGGQS